MSFFRVSENESFEGPHQKMAIHQAGVGPGEAEAVFIMVHGRGASAQSILTLANEFDQEDKLLLLAPQASGNTWYPFSFLMPTEQNQPGLNSGLQAVANAVKKAKELGFNEDKIFILGFSQGACLATEFVARHPQKFAGIIALSGGVIGHKVDNENYTGSLEDTPVFLGCSDVDFHIPVERVNETETLFNQLDATVIKKIYPGMGHTVIQDEIHHINSMIEQVIG